MVYGEARPSITLAVDDVLVPVGRLENDVCVSAQKQR